MVTEFALPDVGEGLAEAEIVRWLVAPGDQVREDDAIVQIETAKAIVEITAPVTGTLVKHGAAEGQVVPVGALLAVFESDSTGQVAGHADPADAPVTVAASAEPRSGPAPAGTGAPAGRRPKATPATRGLARQLGVDLATLTGSGPGGRIIDDDVRRAADGGPVRTAMERPVREPTVTSTGAEEQGQDERVPLRGVRRAVARAMTQAWTTVPHVNSVHEVNLHELQRLRAALADGGHKLSVTAFLVRAAALALREYPILNAEVDESAEEIIVRHRRNIGVAVDATDGLIVPVIDDADHKSVAAIAAELRDLVTQAQERTLPQDRLRGGTFTVNNYGPLGGWFGTSLVKPPEVGILSLGPARDQVVPHDGEIVVRPVAVLALAADHRVADGRELIGFCRAVHRRLASPLTLLAEE